MVLNPKNCQTKFTGTIDSDYQPNGVDLRVGRIYTYSPTDDYFLLTDNDKHKRTLFEANINTEGVYSLTPGYYVIEFSNTISVGDSECGTVYPRSTLMRNGLMVHTAVYDSGYNGPMCAGLTVNVTSFIGKGTRVAQYVVQDADANGTYNGQYQSGKKII